MKIKPIRSAVLISTSPRRRELLRRLVPSLRILSPRVSELQLEGPRDLLRNARVKFDSVKAPKADLVISADTAVFLGKRVLGKPVCTDDALEMLRLLSGKWHTVVTAIVLKVGGRKEEALVTTRVHFRKLSERLITAYAETGEPLDKAGAYGIQGIGGLLVREIEGDYYNVVGLPLPMLEELLQKHHYSLVCGR